MKTIKNRIQFLECLLTPIVTSSCSAEKLTDSYKYNSDGLFEEALVDLQC